jgi:hypothetical protein
MATDPMREQGPDPMSGRDDLDDDEADVESEREAEEDVLEEERKR